MIFFLEGVSPHSCHLLPEFCQFHINWSSQIIKHLHCYLGYS
jgi:hypothetical protein